MALAEQNILMIRKSFPPQAIQLKKSFKNEQGKQQYLIGVKPQYIIERLNDCFGHEGWDFEIIDFGEKLRPGDFDNAGNLVLDKEKKPIIKWNIDIWVKGRLTIYVCKSDENAIDGPLIRKMMTVKNQFGYGTYSKWMSYGDACKGAATNSLEKCASLLDIAHEAYKGLLEVPSEHPEAEVISKDKAKNKLATLCKQHGIDKPAFKQLIQTVFKKEISKADMTDEQMEQLCEYLEKNKAPF